MSMDFFLFFWGEGVQKWLNFIKGTRGFSDPLPTEYSVEKARFFPPEVRLNIMASPPLKKRKLESAKPSKGAYPAAKHGDCTISPSAPEITRKFLEVEAKLCASLNLLVYPPSVTHIYDPLSYAAETHSLFISRHVQGSKKILFVGMNPGPFGMAQNGVGLFVKKNFLLNME